MTKRVKFVIISLLLSLALLAIQTISLEWRYTAILIFSLLTYGLVSFALLEDLKGVEWLTLLTLPVLYNVSVALFYFLLPEKLLTRIIILALFAVGSYALLLTENIFSIAAIRTIQLLRAAHAVYFLLTLLTAFFLFDTMFSFRLMPWFNSLIAIVISLPLFLSALWAVKLEKGINEKVCYSSLILSFLFGQLAFLVSFWPLSVPAASLLLVVAMYIGLGIFQHHFSGRLFKKTLQEYIWVGLIVFLVTFLTASWT